MGTNGPHEEVIDPNRNDHIDRLPAWIAPGRYIERWHGPVLIAVGVAVIVSALIVAIVHLDDRYHVTHVSGSWLALNWYAEHGTLYPPLYEDGYFGGTRFSPLAILWNYSFSLVFGHPVVATKMAAIVSMTAVLVLLYRTLRRVRATRGLAFVLMASVLVTQPGFVAFSAPFRGDPAPIVLQLAALLFVARPERTTRDVAIAAALCALAVFFKLTAGFAIIAIGILLLAQNRRQLAVLCGVWFGLVFVLFMVFNVLTDGRYIENIAGLSASNLGGGLALLGTPGAMNYILIESARVTWVGVPLGVVGVVRALNHRRISVFQIAWIVSGGLLLIMLSDSGVSFNHFLAFVVMTALVIGELWVSFDYNNLTVLRPERALVVVALLWTIAGDYDRVVADDVRAAFRGTPQSLELDFAGELANPADHLLSEDPLIPILLGQRPVVIDAWMVTKIGAKHPEAVEQLVRRVTDAEFTKVILLVGMEEPQAKTYWYKQHFGLKVIEALEARYQLSDVRNGYRIWTPKPVSN